MNWTGPNCLTTSSNHSVVPLGVPPPSVVPSCDGRWRPRRDTFQSNICSRESKSIWGDDVLPCILKQFECHIGSNPKFHNMFVSLWLEETVPSQRTTSAWSLWRRLVWPGCLRLVGIWLDFDVPHWTHRNLSSALYMNRSPQLWGCNIK